MQSQYWVFTDNVHFEEKYWQEWLDEHKEDVEAVVMQLEKVGHVHVQGFLISMRRLRFGQVKQLLPGAHIERMKATPREAWDYCLKEASRASENYWRLVYGEAPPPARPGKRTDIETIRDLVREGKTWLQICDAVPSALRYRREIDSYRAALEETKEQPIEEIVLRPWQEELLSTLRGPVKKRQILWVWSPYSGVGKTTTMHYFAAKNPGSVLVGDKNLSNLMCAYNKHRVIWFDFSRSDPLDASATTVLEQLSNGGPLFAGKYMSSQKWVSAHVVVTCNRGPPEERLPNRCVEYCIDENGQRVGDLAVQVVE